MFFFIFPIPKVPEHLSVSAVFRKKLTDKKIKGRIYEISSLLLVKSRVSDFFCVMNFLILLWALTLFSVFLKVLGNELLQMSQKVTSYECYRIFRQSISQARKEERPDTPPFIA